MIYFSTDWMNVQAAEPVVALADRMGSDPHMHRRVLLLYA